MLDYLTLTSLILLIVAHGFLIRGCFGIRSEIPNQGGAIGSRMDTISEYLDEVAQLISDLSDNMVSGGNSHPPSSPFEAILSSLISNMTMPPDYAEKVEEWAVQENNPQEKVEAETESIGYSDFVSSSQRSHTGSNTDESD